MQLIDNSGAADILGRPFVFLRIEFPNHTAIGPFRMGVLEAVDRCGSISAAGKARGLNYRQTWNVVRYLNAVFDEPLIQTIKGRRGGVRLTSLGERVLKLFRESERVTNAAISRQLKELDALQLRMRTIAQSA